MQLSIARRSRFRVLPRLFSSPNFEVGVCALVRPSRKEGSFRRSEGGSRMGIPAARAQDAHAAEITHETWEQIRIAYAAGIGLRELSRKLNIAEGTVLAHAERHRWP